MKIVLATNNANKLREFREILEPLGFEVMSQTEAGADIEVEETGTTFEENSYLKAKGVYDLLHIPVIADDSGLCVDALNGAPGVFSARYAGGHGNEQACRDKILDELKGKDDRSANFTCCMAMIDKNGNEYAVLGQTFGKILTKETGDISFCYDCLFYSSDLQKCFGLCTSEEKNSVSHRGRAVEKIKQILDNL